MATLEEKVKRILSDVRKISHDVIGAAVVGEDGLILGADVPEALDEGLLGTMASILLGTSKQISNELMRIPPEQTYVKSENGYIILTMVGSGAVLVLLTTTEIKLGLIFYHLKRSMPEWSKMLDAET